MISIAVHFSVESMEDAYTIATVIVDRIRKHKETFTMAGAVFTAYMVP